ncbi:hypothetical protein [Alteribacillus bidgolensis]|uniref:Uncharacterized protein n=1 Tax=Alteribacillus bidgolensis TaxID=930129 RepID=A0A1G8Q8H7_9BACI|nr:hypothetical protein [Alteribacillus bidgolensis]SDJ01092.1 hypothetical protein SAMN05216352_11846 [Alteribacillus bidgolensis]
MLTLEEYIARRKREDRLNEFDIDSRMDDMKTCVNYVFDYFNQHLDEWSMNEQTVLNSERLQKFKKQLGHYDPDIQEWLVNIYDEYDKQLNRSIINFLKKDELFLLYHTDSEFRNISYDCYSALIKKNPFLKGQTEMLFRFIKGFHDKVSDDINDVYITEDVNQWVERTWMKYKVNMFAFASNWVNRFFDNESLWPVKHKRKTNESGRKYEYDIKQKSNLFNMNLFYKKVSNKPFIKGKKQFIEILLMWFWLQEIDDSQKEYWEEYLEKSLS